MELLKNISNDKILLKKDSQSLIEEDEEKLPTDIDELAELPLDYLEIVLKKGVVKTKNKFQRCENDIEFNEASFKFLLSVNILAMSIAGGVGASKVGFGFGMACIGISAIHLIAHFILKRKWKKLLKNKEEAEKRKESTILNYINRKKEILLKEGYSEEDIDEKGNLYEDVLEGYADEDYDDCEEDEDIDEDFEDYEGIEM